MTTDLEEDMVRFDEFKKDEDFDAIDWKKEIENFSPTEKQNLFRSPLHQK